MTDDHGERQAYPPRAQRLLAAAGSFLLLAGVVALFVGKPVAVVTAALIIGSGLLLISVLAPRLEGKQELSLQRVILRLTKAVAHGENEVASGKLQVIEMIDGQLVEAAALPGSAESAQIVDGKEGERD